jgi:hypothetical protein
MSPVAIHRPVGRASIRAPLPGAEARMFGKNKLFAVVVVATAALPYLMSSKTGLTNLVARAWPTKADAGAIAPETSAGKANFAGQSSAATEKHASGLGGEVIHPLEDVLRFDITTGWVLGNWSRVSAGLAELDMQGYRVPLVSGITDGDVAGALTYYFNPKQRVERITFFGTTGDAGKLVALLESRYGFKRMVVPEPNLFVYQVKSWGKVTSEMRIRPAPVVRSDAPRSRFEVALLIDRPKSMD